MTDSPTISERSTATLAGFPIVVLFSLTLAVSAPATLVGFIQIADDGFRDAPAWWNEALFGGLAGVLLSLFMLRGLFMVEPNQGAVLTFFGRYTGTVRTTGLRWTNPFFVRRKVSLRVRNFESDKLKVNELEGSPIEVAAIVVWRVVDTAEAMFHVDSYIEFVRTQAEAAIRQMATSYPYDGHDEADRIALRSHADEISARLLTEIQGRLENAGVEVIEARISHLAYAPEIASAMLQRQQASAVVAARARIVEGAVGMVEDALGELSRRKLIELDDERRVQMVTNLMVVLCGDRNPQPIVNTGSLY